MSSNLHRPFRAIPFLTRRYPRYEFWSPGIRQIPTRRMSKTSSNDMAKSGSRSLIDKSNNETPVSRFPEVDGIPGVRYQDFKNIFQETKVHNRKEYPIRWDWHLRMFLYSLVPAGLLWLFTVYVDYFLASDPEIQDLLKDNREIQRETRRSATSLERLQEVFEKRIADLEIQLEGMKAQLNENPGDGQKTATSHEKVTTDKSAKSSIVENARQWSRQMSRLRGPSNREDLTPQD